MPLAAETELYRPVKTYLESLGYLVRAEVKDCDVAATKTVEPGREELVIVELKKGMTLELLSQGVKRQKGADRVYLAIPKPRKFWFSAKWRDILHVLRRLELGLLLVDVDARKSAQVELILDAKAFDRARSVQTGKKKRTAIMKEIAGRSVDANLGGSRGVPLVTAYRLRSLEIASSLAAEGPSSPMRLRTDAKDSRTAAILQRNVYGWFRRIEKGVYELSPEGRAALSRNAELLSRA